MARYKSAARDLGAFICFEDEAGQGLRPPKGRTWPPRGARPVVRVRGAGQGIWSLTKRAMANFAAADLGGLVRIIKRKLKKVQYRPHLIDGCRPPLA